MKLILNETASTASLKVWHEKLGHVNKKYVREMINKELVDNIKASNRDF